MNNISIEVFHEEFIKLFQHDDVLFYPYRQQPIQSADPRKKMKIWKYIVINSRERDRCGIVCHILNKAAQMATGSYVFIKVEGDCIPLIFRDSESIPC